MQASPLEETWRRWRGSPDLVAHIARTAIRAARTAGPDGEPRCEVRVEVKGDEEIHEEPWEFRDRVTPEGLSRFRAIRVAVDTDAISVLIVIARKPVTGLRQLQDSDGVDREGVTLLIEARDDAANVENVRATVAAAIDRGRPVTGRVVDNLIYLPLAFALLLGTVLALRSLYSTQHSEAGGLGLYFIVIFPVFFFAASFWITRWLRPPVEVASLWRSRLARVALFAVPPLLAIMVAGASKAIWGG